jgi:hypothetical protein
VPARRPLALLTAALAFLPVAASAAPADAAQTAVTAQRPDLARPADAFVDSVGIQTHMNYFDTAYADWPRVVSSVRRLRVRHLRDGMFAMPQSWGDWTARVDRAVRQTGDAGLDITFGMGFPGWKAGSPEQLAAKAAGQYRGVVEALEGPNEYDFSGRPEWAAELREYQGRLAEAIRAQPNLRRVPILAPALASGVHDRVGDLSTAVTRGNLHAYPGGKVPEADLSWPLTLQRMVSRDAPVWITETGYHTAPNARYLSQPGVSERAQAIYQPRLLLDAFRRGFTRTYTYELLDEKPDPEHHSQEQHFGLLRHDFSPKPAFHAQANLLALLDDGGRRARSRRTTIQVAGPGDTRHLVLTKRDGSTWVAVWRAMPVWDTEARRAVPAPSAPVTVTLPGVHSVRSYAPTWSRRGRALGRVGQVQLQVGATVRLLRVAP